MDARGRIPLSSSGRSVQAPGMMRHGPFPGLEPSSGHRTRESPSHSELLDNKISVQAAEMERLAVENHRLAATHVGLREDLVSAQQDVQRLKAHIRSIQTESDIQIRILLDKIAKMEADIRVGENVKMDLRQAHTDARNLVIDKQELTARIQQASQELQKISADVRKLPEMHAEIDNLRKEHERLRAIFEHEKGSNIEQVKQMQLKEKSLLSMAREVERLRIEISNAENRARAPVQYGGGYTIPDPSYQPHMQGGVAYVDSFGRPLVQMGGGVGAEGMVPYSNNIPTTASGGRPLDQMSAGVAGEGMVPYDAAAAVAVGSTAVSTSSSGAVWGGGVHHVQGGVAYVDGYGRPLVQTGSGLGAEGMVAYGSSNAAGAGAAQQIQGGVAYVDVYGRPLVQMAEGMVPYSNNNPGAASGGRPVDQTSGGAAGEGMVSHGNNSDAAAGSANVSVSSGGAVWGGVHNPSLAQR